MGDFMLTEAERVDLAKLDGFKESTYKDFPGSVLIYSRADWLSGQQIEPILLPMYENIRTHLASLELKLNPAQLQEYMELRCLAASGSRSFYCLQNPEALAKFVMQDGEELCRLILRAHKTI